MNPRYFKSGTEFRRWLDRNHDKRKELVVGYHKVKTGKPSMTWSESVDEALCYGWIDGIRRKIDEERYCIRFTPRRPGSNWSAVNIRKVAKLEKEGRMRPAGRKAFAGRLDSRSEIYGYEKEPVDLSPDFARRLRANKKAWQYFSAQAPSYQRQARHWIMSAKREDTRLRRLEKLIEKSLAGERVY